MTKTKVVKLADLPKALGMVQTGARAWELPPKRERWEIKRGDQWMPISRGEALAKLGRALHIVPRSREGDGVRPARERGSRRSSGSSSSSARGDPDPDPEPGHGSGPPLLFLVHPRYGRVNAALARFLRERGL
jgi:hypothetical protein